MEQNTCNKCGRPMQYATEPKCNYNDCCMSEYCGCKLGRIKEIEPTCENMATIPSITVDSVEGVSNLANCLVHVEDINTTFYIDDKHRVMITWAGPVDIPGYDMESNPNGYRDQIVTDIESETAVIYDKHGNGFLFGITDDNLQTAVNNKINKMIEDGTFESIVATHLEDVSYSFNTVADMKAATNLPDSGFAETAGFHALGDGGGATYKIRTITSQDVTDEITLIALADNTLVAELVPKNETIYTKQFGIVGDGVTDEGGKLQAFFAYGAKFYKVNSENILVDADIALSSNSIIEFAKGCRVTRKATDSDWYFILNITNKENIELRNAHIVGDRDYHIGTAGQQGMGINISWSRNIYLKDCIVEKTWGDGYYIGQSFFEDKVLESDNNVLENCIATHCSRNGFALCAGRNHKLINCSSDHNDRHNPKAGLDIEPEGRGGVSEGLFDCEVINFHSSYNQYGIQVYSELGPAKGIFITGHQSENDKHGLWYSQLDQNALVNYNNALIRNTEDHAVVVWRTDVSENPELIIKDVVVDSCQNSSKRALYIDGDTTRTSGNIMVDNFVAKNSDNTNEFATLVYVTDTTGVNFNNLVFRNIDRHDAAANILKMYVKSTVGDIKFENSNIQFDLSAGDLFLNTYYNEVFSLNSDAATNLYIQDNACDGLYRYWFMNDDASIVHNIVFNNGVKAYYGSTVVSSGTYTTKSASGYSGHLDFYKQGDTIYIIDVSGYTL